MSNLSTEQSVQASESKRPLCITLPNDSVVIRGQDFDAMQDEIHRLKRALASADKGSQNEQAKAWSTVFNRLLEIDPNMCGRTGSGLADALSLINELAARPKP